MISTEISPDVAALVEALSAVTPGQTITYADLSKTIGRDIQAFRWLVLGAQKIAARDHGAVFANEHRVGYRRLLADELHTVGHTARSAVRRKVRKAGKMIRYGASRANDVSAEAGRKMNAELSALALLEYAAKDTVAAPVKAHDEKPEPIGITARRMIDALGAPS